MTLNCELGFMFHQHLKILALDILLRKTFPPNMKLEQFLKIMTIHSFLDFQCVC